MKARVYMRRPRERLEGLFEDQLRLFGLALLGVACPSTKSCFAAGYQTNNGVRHTIVEHWNGTKWGIMETPDPKGTTIATLGGVSCASTETCFAVGQSAVSMVTPSLSLAERYS